MPYLILLFVILFAVLLVIAFQLIMLSLGLSILLAGIALLLGIVTGALTPISVFHGKKNLKYPPLIADPYSVHKGLVIKDKPLPPCSAFPWDMAWPSYFPIQYENDIAAVLHNMRDHERLVFFKGEQIRARLTPRNILLQIFMHIVLFLLLTFPIWSYVIGRKVSSTIFRSLSWILGLSSRVSQSLVAQSIRLREQSQLKKSQAGLHCIYCYRGSLVPFFECSNPNCSTIHRDLRPGKLGVIARYCNCGQKLPTGILKSSQRLVSLCPYCQARQPRGTGSRTVMKIPVFGAVSAGKTQFLSTAIVELHTLAVHTGGKLSAITRTAQDFMDTASAEISEQKRPQKTAKRERLESLPYIWESGQKNDFEVQLIDTAGENFATTEESRSLSYFDTAHTLVYIFDPLHLGEVHTQLNQLHLDSAEIQASQGQAESSYNTLVDRLRNDGIDLSDKKLAFVVSKADIVNRVLPNDPLPNSSTDLKEWLIRNGADGLIRRIEFDFTAVEYFAICSYSSDSYPYELRPLSVIQWVAQQYSLPQLTQVNDTEHSSNQGVANVVS